LFSVEHNQFLLDLSAWWQGRLVVSVIGQTIRMQREGGSELMAGALVSIQISGVRNRMTVGSTSIVALELFRGNSPSDSPRAGSSLGERSDLSANVSTMSIRAGVLMGATVRPSSVTAFASGVRFFLSFRPAATGLPASSRIIIGFPEGLQILSVSRGAFSLSGTLEVSRSVERQEISLQRAGGSDIIPGGLVEIELNGVRNYYAGWTGNFSLWTEDANGGLHEEALDVAGFQTVPCALGVTGTMLDSTLTGEDTALSLTVSLCAPLNLGARDGGLLRLILPDGFQVEPTLMKLVSVMRRRPQFQQMSIVGDEKYTI
jgi:hypothetical protein